MFNKDDWTSNLLWLLAFMLCGASVSLLVHAKVHQLGQIWAPWTWCLPLMILSPSFASVDLHRRIAKATTTQNTDIGSSRWSRSLAGLLCATNGTILVCIALLLNAKY